MRGCVNWPANALEETQHRVRRSSTATRSRRTRVAHTDLTEEDGGENVSGRKRHVLVNRNCP